MSACSHDTVCKGCARTFKPIAFGRQYCSRDCYEATLERRRGGRPPERNRSGAPAARRHGQGQAVSEEARAYIRERLGHVGPAELRTEVATRYGREVSTATIYRVWRHAEGTQ